jgi:hypothetical protein
MKGRNPRWAPAFSLVSAFMLTGSGFISYQWLFPLAITDTPFGIYYAKKSFTRHLSEQL